MEYEITEEVRPLKSGDAIRVGSLKDTGVFLYELDGIVFFWWFKQLGVIQPTTRSISAEYVRRASISPCR